MHSFAAGQHVRFVLIHVLVLGLGLSGAAPRVMACSLKDSSCGSASASPCLRQSGLSPRKVARSCCCGAPDGRCCKMACCRTAPVREPAAPPTRDGNQRELQSLAIVTLSMPPCLEHDLAAAHDATSISGDGLAALTLQLAHVRIQA